MPVCCLKLRRIIPIILHSNESQTEIISARGNRITPVAPRQADTDQQLTELWIHGRSPHTQRAYRSDVEQFFGFVEKPLRTVTLGDIQGFADTLDDGNLQPASRHRKLSAIKSLLSFAHRLGYTAFDVGRPLRLPSIRETLSGRILAEPEVNRMIALEPNPRNRVMLLVLYGAGLRVSEACALKWRDVQERDGGCQITVFGKRGKTRTILLPNSVSDAIYSLRNGTADMAPIFKSRKNGHLHPSQVMRIVRKAAQRAGIEKDVSPHWLRHAHASHALDRGAGIHLVQATLGHASVATTGRYLHARPTDSSAKYLGI